MADTSTSGQLSKNIRENVSKWDVSSSSLAPLSDGQRDCVLELTTLMSNRPLPAELKDEDSESTRLSIADVKVKQKNDWLDSLCSSTITNTQQFYSWFCEIQNQMEVDDEVHYNQYIKQLEQFQSQCNGLLDEVSGSLHQLTDLQNKHEFVSTKTNSLHQSCEHLLEEQTKLMNVAEAINSKLSYYNELDRINSKLGSTSLTVTSEGFIPMLSRIDECIAYIQSNPSYKDSPGYLIKFHQCLSRALNLIKAHVTNLLNNATQNVQPSKGAVTATSVSDDIFTLFYGKFRTNAPRVKSLIEQIERRADKNVSYDQLLTDCHQCYVHQRELLVEPSVAAAVSDLTVKHKTDYCALMRSGCALMVHICEDEYKLYQHFFNKPSILLDEFLERLCSYLYDAFRPLIIQINHMETLSELCSILKIEMLEDHVYNNPQPLRSFEKVSLQMLQDVQERLVYRTYIYINSDILNYKPAAGDLAYPDKLEMMQSIAESLRNAERRQLASSSSMTSSTQSLESQEVEAIVSGALNESNGLASTNGIVNGAGSLGVSSNSTMPMSPADLHGMWYPTVRKTLVCLSKLSRCIDATTFQGLSQEALTLCIQSLLLAKRLISTKKTPLDGHLFYIKHLLIIREQITPFQAPFSVKETQIGFSHIKDAALGLVKRSKDLFKFNSNNALLQFIFDGTPQALEHLMDSKQEVDQQLKISCSEFIDLICKQLLTKLEDFLQKADVILKMSTDGSSSQFKSQPFAKTESVRDLVAECYRTLKTKVPSIHHSMSLYLANRETEAILFKPIKNRIINGYERLNELIGRVYSEEETLIIACPPTEQVSLVLSK